MGDNKPRFKHDCINCIFLGTSTLENVNSHITEVYDLYFHRGIVWLTVVARFGDNPEDYLSGLGITMRPLLEAQLLAVKKGLLQQKEIKIGGMIHDKLEMIKVLLDANYECADANCGACVILDEIEKILG